MKTHFWLLAAVLIAVAPGGFAQAPAPEPVPLFNGQDLSGWKPVLEDAAVDPATVWSVSDGVLRCTGAQKGYMRTEESYGDYRLTLEWRWPAEPGNSGVLLHITGEDAVWPKSIEAQLHRGNAGDFWVIGGTEFNEHQQADSPRVRKRRTFKLTASTEYPAGEWNQYDVICKGDTIQLYVNGILQNEATGVTVTGGRIGLQSEGAPIEFRNITLTPLKK